MAGNLVEKFEKYFHLYRAETDDEELVFLATATVEGLLFKILKKYLVVSNLEIDTLLDRDRPLAGFGTRINLAHRMGIISEGLFDELHLLRRIRKEFKNKIDCGTLEYRDVKEFCEKFKAPMSLKSKSESLRKDFPDTERGNFELTVVIMSSLLEDLLDKVERISRSPLY